MNDYFSHSDDYFIPEGTNSSPMSFDFNPNDNVTTEIIVNDVPFDPDYFLLFDAEEEIVSRWFVTEQKRNRQGQWIYSLKRDVIADNINSLLSAPVFVQKGRVGEDNPLILNGEGMNFNQIKTSETLLKDPTGSAWIVAYYAKDYPDGDITIQNVPAADYKDSVTVAEIASAIGITESQLSDNININNDRINKLRFVSKVFINFCYKQADSIYDWQQNQYFTSDLSERTSVWEDVAFNPSNKLFSTTYQGADTKGPFRAAVYNHRSEILADMTALTGEDFYLQYSQFKNLKAYEGKIVRYLGKYYQLKVVDNGGRYVAHRRNFSYTTYPSLKAVAEEVGNNPSINLESGGHYVEFGTRATEVYFVLEEISDSMLVPVANAKISSNRNITTDQQYDIICAPASALTLDDGVDEFTTDPDLMRRIFAELAIQHDANVYDIQLLPYCPIPSLVASRDISGMVETKDFDYVTVSGNRTVQVVCSNKNEGLERTNRETLGTTVIGSTIRYDMRDTYALVDYKSGSAITVDSYEIKPDLIHPPISDVTITADDTTGTITIAYKIVLPADAVFDDADFDFDITYHYARTDKAGALFYAPKASFQIQLNYSLSIVESKKIDSQCDLYRIISPNYQGSFDFNVAKNGGSVDFFTAYCTYKPFSPFIKVTPNFEWMYGADFNDNRGLICAGDFSLPRVQDKWETYQLENKNYQNIFNREIQSLDIAQGLEARQQYITGGLGILTDSIKGGVAGGMIGGGYGAIAGAIVGAGASAVGYGADISIMARQHQEARSIAIDKFNYQLGNIKALPYTLTKVGSFDISSKIFPVLEYYTCSEEEKQALRNKIKYESMTIMAIGLFGDYYQAFEEPTYFKGELIRCDDIADDSHILNEIYAELLKGVYI